MKCFLIIIKYILYKQTKSGNGAKYESILYKQTKSGNGTKYESVGLLNLKDFYMVSGWLAGAQYKESDKSDFNWDDGNLGIIKGNVIKLRDILSESKFKNFRIETKINYQWRNCIKDFQAPCPYFYTAIASLVAPIFLALFTLLIIFCWSKYLKKGMYQFVGTQ